MWNIVIVDDENRIADGLARIISKIGEHYHVKKIFYDSESAYRWMKNNHTQVDLLITDICMPRISGLELLEKIRKFNPYLQCIILTGFGEFEYAQRAISLGCIGYLLKPIDKDELKKILERLILMKQKFDNQEGYIRVELSKETRLIKKEIETNYKEFNMNQISNILGLSKEYLYRLFRKEMNAGVNEYLLDVRMKLAREYLSETGKYKVYEVCEKVGYTDQIYFSKTFKKIYGITPKEFQKYVQNQKINKGEECYDT